MLFETRLHMRAPVNRRREDPMKTLKITLVALCLVVAAAPAQAERPWALELRAGGGPSSDPESVALDAGFGFEPLLEYRFMPHALAYGGWDWHHFASDQSFAGTNMDFEETGYAVGLRFEHPFGGETGVGPAWWVRAGATYNHIEIENPDGDIIGDSGHGFGWEAGAGATFHVAERWSLTPGMRYRALTRDITVSGATSTVDLNYVLFEVGISRSF
jgi:outer membrane protein with beta-barrel domain